jgi:hypothetical protein
MPKSRPANDPNDLKNTVLLAIEASLDAQLRAVRRLRLEPEEASQKSTDRRGKSHVDLAEDILRRAGSPLHITDILQKIKEVHGVEIDRESLVSALSKKVLRGDRFVRSGPNLFALGAGKPEVTP